MGYLSADVSTGNTDIGIAFGEGKKYRFVVSGGRVSDEVFSADENGIFGSWFAYTWSDAGKNYKQFYVRRGVLAAGTSFYVRVYETETKKLDNEWLDLDSFTPDWTAGQDSLHFIRNRPFYEELVWDKLFDGTSTSGYSTVGFDIPWGIYYYPDQDSSAKPFAISLGKVYLVVINGEEFTAESRYIETRNSVTKHPGIYLEGKILIATLNSGTAFIYHPSSARTVTLKVYERRSVITPLDSRFLTMDLAPTQGSNNPVTSASLYTKFQEIAAKYAPGFKDDSVVGAAASVYTDSYILSARSGTYSRVNASTFMNYVIKNLTVSSLLTSAKTVLGAINELKNSMSDLQNSNTSMQNQISTLNSDLNSLRTVTNTQAKTISSLRSTVQEQAGLIGELEQAVSYLEARVARLEAGTVDDGGLSIIVSGDELQMTGGNVSVEDGVLVIDSPLVSIADGVLVYNSASGAAQMDGDVLNLTGNGFSVDADGVLNINTGSVAGDGTLDI